MSKTDKTKPFYLKLAHGDLDWEEVHDHTDGVCDLPPVEDVDSYWRRDTNCWRSFVYTGTHTCCCTHCHGDTTWDVRPGKRQRINSKRACRDWELESGHWYPCRCGECIDWYMHCEYGTNDLDDESQWHMDCVPPEVAARYLGGPSKLKNWVLTSASNLI